MRKRHISLVTVLSVILLFLAPGLCSAADSGNAGADPLDISFHGFFDTSAFWQDDNFFFGNGQNAELPLPSSATSNNLSGVDIRNTRVWWDISGASLPSGWKIGGHLEADFFGGFNGTGPYSSSQATPRLRQAFFTVSSPDGGSSLSVGQQWELVFPLQSVPTSLAHIAFPLGFGTGMIGWRYPGLVWHQMLSNPPEGGTKWRLDLGAFTGQWDGPGSNVNYETAANVNLRPQLEARLNMDSGSFTGYAVGYYSSENLSGVGGTTATPIKDTITSNVLELGAAWHPGAWSLVGALYAGKGIGQLFGSLAQFGDISDHGGFVQGGYKFTSNWGLYATVAMDQPNEGEVIQWKSATATARLKGQQAGLDLIYTDGPFGAGVEWMHGIMHTTSDGINRTTTVGNQLSLSGIYHF